jgi:hypothetical protein
MRWNLLENINVFTTFINSKSLDFKIVDKGSIWYSVTIPTLWILFKKGKLFLLIFNKN